MLLGNSWLENRLEMRLHLAHAHRIGNAGVAKGAPLPFELFLYAKRGDFSFALNGGKPVICKDGNAALVPSDTAFRIEADPDCEIGLIGADYRIFTGVRLLSFFILPPNMGDGDKKEGAGNLCRLILQTVRENEFTNSRLENAVIVNAALYRLALAVLRCSVSCLESAALERLERLSPVLAYIGDHLGHAVSVEELARFSGMSEDAFYRLFKDTLGISPKEYLISARLRHARLLLLESALSIGAISRLCGYESPFSFSSLFHERYGCPPSLYRAQMSALL